VRWFGGAAAVKPAKAPSTWDGVVAAGQRLWVTGDGTPCTAAALQKLLEKRTRARFERVINTHLFRDCAATSIATDDPEHVMVAARLLGHAMLRTTERHYVAADTRAALERHHGLVRAIRKPSRALPRAGRQRHT
jgi:integrase